MTIEKKELEITFKGFDGGRGLFAWIIKRDSSSHGVYVEKDGLLFEAYVMPENYPSWHFNVITKEEAIETIKKDLEDWGWTFVRGSIEHEVKDFDFQAYKDV